jgi:uncharacterized membrane protein YoaK (UPF0700 family)
MAFAGGRDFMVLMLTWAAGSMDAISYLGLNHVFTANMTGNAVLLGLAVGQGHGLAALRSVIALAGFALGVAIGAWVVERGPKRGEWPRGVTGAVLAEGVVLLIFTLTWQFLGAGRTENMLYALIALSAVAMGIQSAAIRHLNVPGVATTYITGTLTSMVAGVVSWMGAADVRSSTARPGKDPAKRRMARLQAAVFSLYAMAAAASGFLQAHWPRLASWSPLIAVTLVLANAALHHQRE